MEDLAQEEKNGYISDVSKLKFSSETYLKDTNIIIKSNKSFYPIIFLSKLQSFVITLGSLINFG